MTRRTILAAIALAYGVAVIAEDPPLPRLVIYSAEWCEPCQRLRADIERHPEIVAGLEVEWHDAAELGDRNVRVPDIRVVVGDRVIARTVGYRGRKALAEWLAEVL
jgi:thiol-disulfide isomerase/thioredoxin